MIRFSRGGRQKQNKRQLYASLRHIDAVRSRRKAERGKIVQHSWFTETEMKRSCSQHSYFRTCPFGEGAGTSSMRHVRSSGGSVNSCRCQHYVLAFCLIADKVYHLDIHCMCYIMLVQRFEPQGRRFTNFHYYYCRGEGWGVREAGWKHG